MIGLNYSLLAAQKTVYHDESANWSDSDDEVEVELEDEVEDEDDQGNNLGGKGFEIHVPDDLPPAQQIVNISLLSALFKKQRLENVIQSVAAGAPTTSAVAPSKVPPLKLRLPVKPPKKRLRVSTDAAPPEPPAEAANHSEVPLIKSIIKTTKQAVKKVVHWSLPTTSQGQSTSKKRHDRSRSKSSMAPAVKPPKIPDATSSIAPKSVLPSTTTETEIASTAATPKPIKRPVNELPSGKPSKLAKLAKQCGILPKKKIPSSNVAEKPEKPPKKKIPSSNVAEKPADDSNNVAKPVTTPLDSRSGPSKAKPSGLQLVPLDFKIPLVPTTKPTKKKDKPKSDAAASTVEKRFAPVKVKDKDKSDVLPKDGDVPAKEAKKKHKDKNHKDKKKHKKEKEDKDRHHRHHHEKDGVGKEMSDALREKLREKAKQLSQHFSGGSTGKSQDSRLQLLRKSFRKDRLHLVSRTSSQSKKKANELFVRKSILDRSSSSPAKSHDTNAILRIEKPTPVAVPVQQPVSRIRSGRIHRFVIHNGRFPYLHLLPAGAMAVACGPKQGERSQEEVLILFNNLTAKVTKAVRQNNGFKELDLPLPSVDVSEVPRFAKRIPYRQFQRPGRYTDGRKITGEGKAWKDEYEKKDKRALSKFDAEMRAFEAGRTVRDDVYVAAANGAHLYLFGVHSPYGDSANYESDMRRGLMTPAPVWTKRKPYVQMVINGLKGRGRPHSLYLSPPSTPDATVYPESSSIGSNIPFGYAGPFRFAPPAYFPNSNIRPSTFGMVTVDSSPSTSSMTSVSPAASFSMTSPYPMFEEAGRSNFGEGSAFGRYEFNQPYAPRQRPTLLPPPSRPSTGEYNDYQTRIW